MVTLNGHIFRSGPTLGRGIGDWTDPSTWFGDDPAVVDNSTSSSSTGSSCPAGQLEFGSPSRCGTQADYNAYVQAQVAQAYGGDKKKADLYLQTTVYGQEQGMGCSAPNIKINGNFSADPYTPPHTCLTPSEYQAYLKAGNKPVTGTAPAKTPAVVPGPAPVTEDSVDWLPLAAVGALLAAGGYLVYKKRQRARGLA